MATMCSGSYAIGYSLVQARALATGSDGSGRGGGLFGGLSEDWLFGKEQKKRTARRGELQKRAVLSEEQARE